MSITDQFKIVIFLQDNKLYYRVQDLVERICETGNHVTLFSQQLLPMFRYPESLEGDLPYSPYPKSEDYLKMSVPGADALILLTTEENCHHIPTQVTNFMSNGHANYGHANNGHANYGNASHGHASHGHASHGHASHSHANQGYYSWSVYGVTCLLIGGSVHSRKAAIYLRHLLDDSNYPFVGRVLPEPCLFGRFYDVDPSCETEEPYFL